MNWMDGPEHAPLWELHIFVCANRRDDGHPRPSCGRQGGDDLHAAFKAGLAARGLAGRVRASKSGCLEGCESGPAVVVYPEAIWYTVRTAADVERILDAHVAGGRPVEELRMDFAPLPAWKAKRRG